MPSTLRVVVVVVVLAGACGYETAADGETDDGETDDGEIVPVPPPECESGPEIVATVESCELMLEGSGGPTAARMWTFTIDDDSKWTRFAHAGDGGFYLFGDEMRSEGNLVVLVARFGPDFELEWSRRIVHGGWESGIPLSATLRGFSVDDLGIALSTELDTNPSFGPNPDSWWLTQIGEQGDCAESFSLAFGGSSHCYVGSVQRDPDGLVLAGIAYASTEPTIRGYVQRRTLAGEVLAEIELPAKYGVTHARGHAHGIHTLVEYHEFSLFTDWNTIYRAGVYDSSLALVGSHTLPEGPHNLGVRGDAFGQLYSSAAAEWLGLRQPTRLELTPLESDDAPAGEAVELLISQPQCGDVSLALFDGTLAAVRCSAAELGATLTGYVGSGEPAWTATLACPNAAELRFEERSGSFGEDGRLWWSARTDRRVLIELEF